MNSFVETHNELPKTRSWSTPPVDVYANDAELLVRADLPGVTRENVHVSIHEGTLSIEAVRGSGEQTHAFRRRFRVGRHLDDKAIRAELHDGVLAVHLPKVPEAQPRSIPIVTA